MIITRTKESYGFIGFYMIICRTDTVRAPAFAHTCSLFQLTILFNPLTTYYLCPLIPFLFAVESMHTLFPMGTQAGGKQARPSRLAGRQAGRLAGRQTGRKAGRQAVSQASKQAHVYTHIHTYRHARIYTQQMPTYTKDQQWIGECTHRTLLADVRSFTVRALLGYREVYLLVSYYLRGVL